MLYALAWLNHPSSIFKKNKKSVKDVSTIQKSSEQILKILTSPELKTSEDRSVGKGSRVWRTVWVV